MFWKPSTKYGKFAAASFFIWHFLYGLNSWAEKQDPGSQKGTVIVEEAEVYQKDDFDSRVIGRVKEGQVFDISKRPLGPFFKIRLKQGVLGWISDADIRPGNQSQSDKGKVLDSPPPQLQTKSYKSDRKPFPGQRFRGLAVESQNWIEDTMGATRSETLMFYGAQWAGNDTMFSGEMFTEANLLIAGSPPKYYQELTGHSAAGWIFRMNFAFQTVLPQSRSYYLYYGFGPSFTYSHFDVSLNENSKAISYALEDMSLGAIFDLGIAFRIGSSSPRFSLKYIWEKKQMLGLAGSWGWQF